MKAGVKKESLGYSMVTTTWSYNH